MNDTMTFQARSGRNNNNNKSLAATQFCKQLLRNFFYMEQRSKRFTRVAERFND